MRYTLFLLVWVLSLVFVGNSFGAVEVFVSIGPQKWLADRIGGNQLNTTVLVGDGQDPHTFAPTPRLMTALTNAAIWFTIDMEFENQLQAKVAKVAPKLKIVDIAHQVPKITMEWEAEHDEHGHEDEIQGHEDHEAFDPHVWLSPLNLKIMAGEVARALIAIDGDNASAYSANLAQLNTELESLHAEITKQLTPFRGSSFYVFHPSFGYFANAYGLQQKAVETGGKSPSPRQLAKLIRQARAEQVRVIFVQPQFDPKSARAVALAIGGQVVPLNALARDVEHNLRVMADRIEAALKR